MKYPSEVIELHVIRVLTPLTPVTLNICSGEKEEEEFLLNDASVVKMSVMSVSLV